MADPKSLVQRFEMAMDEDSILMVCDIGKRIKVLDWYLHIGWSLLKQYGIKTTVQILKESARIKRTNLDISKKQKNGTLWLHTLNEFKEMFAKNYEVLEALSCYRDHSNYVICKKFEL